MPGRMVRTAPDTQRRTAVDPLRMTKFLDRGPGLGFESYGNRGQSQYGDQAGGGHLRPHTVYDPSLSWEGMAVNPTPFSKLDIDPRVVGKYLLAGARVMETGEDLPMGLFAGVSSAGPGLKTVPPTLDQRDAKTHSHGADAPHLVAERAGRGKALTYKGERFVNMALVDASVGLRDTCDAVLTATAPHPERPKGLAHVHRHLLTPQERRDILEHEVNERNALGVARKAELQRRRLVQLLRLRHPHGALGVDGTDANLRDNPESVYADAARAKGLRDANRGVLTEARRARIHALTMQEARHGYDPFHHNEEFLSRKDTEFLQTKKVRPSEFHVDSHERLFGVRPRKAQPMRGAHMRERDLNGKAYNLVTGASIVHCPPTGPDRSQQHDYKWMSHPSQQGLDQGRNTQGHIGPPKDRSTGISTGF